jgi:hypothetical protein
MTETFRIAIRSKQRRRRALFPPNALSPAQRLWLEIQRFYSRNRISRPWIFVPVGSPPKNPACLCRILSSRPLLQRPLIAVLRSLLSQLLISYGLVESQALKARSAARDKATNANGAQTFAWTGKVVNQNSQGLDGEIVKAYLRDADKPIVVVDTTRNGGLFRFSESVTGVDDGKELPHAYNISNVYPQPFNPHAYVNVAMPKSGKIKASVFNILGQNVKTLEQNVDNAGVVPLKFDLEGLAQGVYFANIVVSDDKGKDILHQTKKLMYISGSQHAATPSGLILPSSAGMSLGKTNTNASIDSIVVSGDGIVKKAFANPLWVNVPDNYNLGNLTVDQINRLIVGPVYDLDTKFSPSGKQGIKGLKVFLGSEPNNSSLTDSLGMATLYTIKVGKDSVFVIDTTATDTTGFYNWKNPELQIINGDNIVKAFHEDSGIPTKHRGKDRKGEHYLDFVQRITQVRGLWMNPPDPVYKQTVPRFNYEDLPNNEIKIFFNRQALPDWIRFYDEHLRLDSIPKSVYVDSLLKGAKTQDRERQEFVETLDSTNAQIIVEHDNVADANIVELKYDRDAKGPYTKLVRIEIRGAPRSVV